LLGGLGDGLGGGHVWCGVFGFWGGVWGGGGRGGMRWWGGWEPGGGGLVAGLLGVRGGKKDRGGGLPL